MTRIEPITLIDVNSPVEDLVRVALQNRPEIGARSAAVGVATTRYRQELLRPLLPTLWLGFSGGAFGGGSNLVPPLLGNFAGRTDFDVRAYWTLQNMGLGNLSIQKQRRAADRRGAGRTVAGRSTRSAARSAAALAEAIAARGQVDVTARQLATAQAGFREDLDRIRGTIGLPIEVTNSLDLLAEARQNHLQCDHRLRPRPVPALRRARLAAAPGTARDRSPAPCADRRASPAAGPRHLGRARCPRIRRPRFMESPPEGSHPATTIPRSSRRRWPCSTRATWTGLERLSRL